MELLVEDQPERVKEATNQVVQFCKSFDLDITPPINGKVLEFIRIKRPHHFQVLKDSGLIVRKVGMKN